MEIALRHRFWRNRRTFVTGASGLVGSWLTRALVDLGADVVILLRDWVPQSPLLDQGDIEHVTVVRGDLTDQSQLERVVGEYEIKTVFHLAAQTIVPIANRNPISTFESNISGSWRLLEACRRVGCVKQIVLASSDKAYGQADQLPYREDTPLRGLHPYDVSKSCADLIAQCYATTWKSPVVITRCGNFFGGGDLNWNRIVPGTIRSVLHDEAPIIRSNGALIRDYIYVEDAVEAYLTLAETFSSRPEMIGQAYNFSTETPATVLEIVDQILALMTSTQRPRILNEANNEIEQQYLDATRARTELAWRPRFGQVDGLRRTIEWYEQYFKRHAEKRIRLR